MSKPGWIEREHLLIYSSGVSKGVIEKKRLVGFDLDSTLIKTKSGSKFAKDEQDWEWWDPAVLKKLVRLAELGIDVCVITNQSLKPDKIPQFKKKIEAIWLAAVGKDGEVLIGTVYVALGPYRKPGSLIYELHLASWPVFMFVGDAAGRPGDFADSDRRFAYNVAARATLVNPGARISFKTPEEFILGQDAIVGEWTPRFDVREYLDSWKGDETERVPLPTGVKIIFILIGPPASGKSTLTAGLVGAKIISKDKHGKRAVTEFIRAVSDEEPLIVIDDTNPSKSSREKYLSSTSVTSYKVVALLTCAYRSKSTLFNLAKKSERSEQIDLVKHLGRVRVNAAIRANRPYQMIPDVAYNVYNSKFEYPTKSEGFTEIVSIPFIPRFSSDAALLDFLE
jgi:bifunctional polynucleotide phosphatase/kinase